MEILVAKNAGFCFGVQKAVEEVGNQLHNPENASVFTYGEIVHNEAVVEEFSARGVRVLESAEGVTALADECRDMGKKPCVVVRAHGIGREVSDALSASGLRVVDATCPFVKRIHNIVQTAGETGQPVIVAGDAAHPEVQGIVGWATGEVFVISSPEEAESFSAPLDREFTIVSQTTFQKQKFEEIVEILIKKGYNIHVADTICNATGVRQAEAEKIAAEADTMIVIGGARSSNTRKLYEISKKNCADTYLIQNAGDLKGVRLKDSAKVGITAGASTPKKTIEEVLLYVRNGTGSDV